MRIALFAACLLAVLLMNSATAHAQVVVTYYSPQVYAAPVYAAPVYPTTVYATQRPLTRLPFTRRRSTQRRRTPITLRLIMRRRRPCIPRRLWSAPVRVYEHWGHHHVHVYYRW